MQEQTTRHPAGRRVWLLRLSLLFGALTTAVLLGEIGLRLAGVSRVILRQPDVLLGWSLRPDSTEWSTHEAPQMVKTNRWGFRDVEREQAKPADTFRIAVIGDSCTEAVEVGQTETFCQQLEKMLNEKLGSDQRKFEVLSFGVVSYGTAQQLLTLRHRVFDFQPDLVLAAVYLGNDLTDNSKELDNPGEKQLRPFFVLDGDTLRLDDSFNSSPAFERAIFWNHGPGRWLFFHSRVFQTINSARKALRNHADAGAHADRLKMGLDALAPPRDARWEESWRVTAALLGEMNVETKRRGIAFGVVTLSVPEQVYPDPAVRAKTQEELGGLSDLFYADRRVAAIGKAAGFPVLNLAEPMQHYADEKQAFLHGFPTSKMGIGHWNAAGHKLAAEMIFDWLRSVAPQLEGGTVRAGRS